MDDLLDDFIAETRETMEAIAGELVAWESDPGNAGRLDAIFRFVHTVKGSCGFLDLPRLETLSHACESALADVRAGQRTPDAALVDAVLAIVDRIGELADALESERSMPAGDDDALIEALVSKALVPAGMVEQVDTQPRSVVARSIRLPVELLDRMMAGVSDMVLARNELSRALRDSDPGTHAALAFERLSQCVGEIRNAVTRTRMARIETLFSMLPRMVRDLSAQLGRKVRLEIDGGDVELDREMIEMIRDPLTHIVRNALDHGIETLEGRRAAGKADTGLLRISARQSGNHILIEATDDGRGIDPQPLVRKAIAAGLITEAAATAMSLAQKLELIFAPGLSTAGHVTAISGRGVGMDVVRANVERIGGSVDVDSRLGHGVRLTLRVPLTLTIIPALVIGCGMHRFALPRSAIDEIVRLNGDGVRLQRIGDGRIASIRDLVLPAIDLADFLGCGEADAPEAEWPVLILLRASFGERFALLVDQVFDHEELVVKPAAPAVMATGFYAGTTLPDNSRPILLIDVAGLAAAGGIDATQNESRIEAAEPAETRTLAATLLFRDLDGAERAIALALVERIEDVARGQVANGNGRLTLAHGGAIIPLHAAAGIDGREIVRVLQLGDGATRLAYAIDEIIDVIDLDHALVPAAAPGPVAGMILVEGRQVEMLDPHWLFAGVARPSPITAPLCRLADEQDVWARQVLAPLLITAGYRVTYDAGPADVVIRTGGTAILMTGDAPVVALRAEPEPVDPLDRSIWRYDRAGLLEAVRTASAARGSRHG